MKVAVVGAGIVGVTTAWELAAQGCGVTVFERCDSVAEQTSFANAGVIAPGYVTPWASPGMPARVLRHVLERHAPVRVHGGLDAHTLAWIWRWWRACRDGGYATRRASMQRLALFSRERLHAITRELQLEFERSDGYLVLLRSAREAASVQPGLAVLDALGTRYRLLDAAQCRAVEPGLDPLTALHGGVHLPDAEVGNCREFAGLLLREARQRGVEFRFATRVLAIEPGRRPALRHAPAAPSPAPATTAAPEPFDAVVVCAALGSIPLLRAHRLHLPMVAVHGYSITAALRNSEAGSERAPRSAVMDERYKVAVSRIGRRVRVAGSAELGSSLHRIDARAVATLYKVLDDWFAGCADLSQVQLWKGARPMLPDGPPVIGASGLDGVWLNLGHGSSGWALACGSARLLAEALTGQPASIRIDGLGLERLRR